MIHFFKNFLIPLQEDPSKAEMSMKMETGLQFPTGANLKDFKEVEGDFSGEFNFFLDSDFSIKIWPNLSRHQM